MADVDSSFKNWSTTAGSNLPSGTTSIGAGLDDNLREIQAVIRAALGSKGADIASASTTDLGAVAGLYHDITGTTTITGFGTVSAGIWKLLQFDGALTLTHNATSLILPSGANITTAAGDHALAFSLGAGNWSVPFYQKATGGPVALITAAMLASDAVTAVKILDGNVTAAKLATGVHAAGPHTIYIPASAMVARTTNGPAAGTVETATNLIMLKTLDFDAATYEYAQFSVRMPKSWNRGTFTAYFVWSNASGTGDVIWGFRAVAISNDDVIDATWGSGQAVLDSVTAAGDLMQTAVAGPVTAGGTPVEADWVVFEFYRAAAEAGDTLAVDARLHGVVLIYTTEASTDA